MAESYVVNTLFEGAFPFTSHSDVQAMATGAAEDKVAATEWCSRDLVPVVSRLNPNSFIIVSG